MTALRFYFGNQRVGDPFIRSNEAIAARIRDAMRTGARQAADAILIRGKQDIASAGNFGARWTDGLQVKVGQGGGNIRIGVTHNIPYFAVFQEGALIRGKPLLWIPAPWATEAQGLDSPTDYPGRLFKVTNKDGHIYLMADADKQVKYIGCSQITVPKKFHIKEIIQEEAHNLKEYYAKRLRQTRG
jgi:hypothetical protein